jgi:hypothetical protein
MQLAHRERVAAASGELVGAAFRFLGELVSGPSAPPPPNDLVKTMRAHLSECIEPDPSGKLRMTVTLPDRAAIEQLADTLARLMAFGQTASSKST